MPKQLRYLGLGQIFRHTIDGKQYKFFSPKAVFDEDGAIVPPEQRGAPVAVNNDHVEELMTYPHTRWEEVADAVPATSPARPVAAQPQVAEVKPKEAT